MPNWAVMQDRSRLRTGMREAPRPCGPDARPATGEVGLDRSGRNSPTGGEGTLPVHRVLVTVPDLRLPGGVTGLFNLLRLDADDSVAYFSVNFGVGRFRRLFLPYLYLGFLQRMVAVDVVHINPSLDAKSYFRDLIFCGIAKRIFSRRTIVYWHGWDERFARTLMSTRALRWLHAATFSRADVQIVLARTFAQDLRSLGVKGEILLESNVAAPVDRCNVERGADGEKGGPLKLLYISRITSGKGWDLALQSMAVLKARGVKDVHLTIAGDGDMLNEARQMARDLGLDNVEFLGYVVGAEKQQLFERCHVLFFPTCYPEGMPLVILEGMMHGMAVVTRRVGGIGDHVDDRCGMVTDSRRPEDFSDYIARLARDRAHLVHVARHNREWALVHFSPERLIARLRKAYEGVAE